MEGILQNWRALGPRPLAVGRGWPLEIRLSPRVLSWEYGRSRSNGTSVIEMRLKKIDPSRPAFKGHSRSSELACV